MNLIKKFKIIIVFSLLTCFNCKAQISCSTTEDENLIVGTWVLEGLTPLYKWVFSSDKLLSRYVEGQLYKTYCWEIDCKITPSGRKAYSLEIINTDDESDKYVYDINTLTQERLVLQYVRTGYGLAKLATYLRQ